jgi:hypothetical protein
LVCSAAEALAGSPVPTLAQVCFENWYRPRYLPVELTAPGFPPDSHFASAAKPPLGAPPPEVAPAEEPPPEEPLLAAAGAGAGAGFVPTTTTRVTGEATVSLAISVEFASRPSRKVRSNVRRTAPSDPAATTRVRPSSREASPRCSVAFGTATSRWTWSRSTRTTVSAAPSTSAAARSCDSRSSPSTCTPACASASPTVATVVVRVIEVPSTCTVKDLGC